jgi:NADPH:quinone reductase
MRAVQIGDYGGVDRLELADGDVPEPGPGQVLVKLDFAGVNFQDVYMREGVYARSQTYPTPLPLVLGTEGAGRIAATGPDVDGLAEGDRVAHCLVQGSYAEYVVAPAWRVVRVPDTVELDLAAALMLQGTTAHYLTHSTYPLAAGDTCLVHAAAGGVGGLLVQLAKERGATVIATVGDAEKAAVARERGADHTILYREEDFRERVTEITGGAGVDVVYDSVGRDTIDRSIRSLRRRGLCVLFGASSGAVEAVSPKELGEAGSVFLTRPHLADYLTTADEIAARTDRLFELVADGALEVTVGRRFALEDAAEAHRALESRATTGKLLLEIG